MRKTYSLVWGSMDCIDLKYSSSRRSANAQRDPHSWTGAPATISSAAGLASGSAFSVREICLFLAKSCLTRSKLLTQRLQMGMGMCVDMDPEMSNCAEMSMMST